MSTEILSTLTAVISGVLLASWDIFTEAAPYLLFGFGVAGLLNVLVPDQKIIDYLGTSAGKVRSVVNASIAGLPLPLCSCGVIPAAMSIRKRGANRGATLSFLISTPQTGVDSIAITYALLDPLMTVFRPLATLATALLAGLADNLLIGDEQKKKETKAQEKPGNRTGMLAVATLIGAPKTGSSCSDSSCSDSSCSDSSCNISSCGCSTAANSGDGKGAALKNVAKPAGVRTLEIKPAGIGNKTGEKLSPFTIPLSIPSPIKESSSCGCGSCGHEIEGEKESSKAGKSAKEKVLEGLRYAYIELPGDISKWMFIGILLAGTISYAVPDTLIQEYLGGGLRSMMVMLVVGIPLYICATASTPLAASLMAKGMSPGTAFVFLLAGPATNAATITMVARFLGKRSAALYLGVISLCALGAGILLDFLYLKLGISATATLGSAGEMLPETVKLGFAVLLLPLMLYGIFRQKKECGCH
ncbi:permease [Methanosarcina sp. KYL-1]|uniref:SO_0444 family Cu/Zn efflux transporter n=1 Tax=Methanosarcina sp. KYL-1 TaxID=2602068 RepID=UPI002100A575|nr:SO_0444 family Cu/Zn efflux transporter [Methanosarcina sp. KYL-1]MCQ1534110.1 permease [Methanosarcina sp. KYL-1]